MMKRKKALKMVVVMTMVLTMMFGTTVSAKENVETVPVEAAGVNASSTIVGPDGNTYTYLGTATRNGSTNYPVEGLLSQLITASGKYHLYFYCPNNNRRDLVQGTVTATPMSGGTVETFTFTNYSKEIIEIDLSNLKGDGLYRIKYSIYAYGTSNSGKVYYRVTQER